MKIIIFQKSPQFPTIWKDASDFSTFLIFNNRQIWLNVLMDDHQLSKIAKLKLKFKN
jgi:hypothetical protein